MAIEYEFSGILHRNEREMLDAIVERWITADGSNDAAFVADYLKGASDLAIAQECIRGCDLHKEGDQGFDDPVPSHMRRNDYTSDELAQAVGRFRAAFNTVHTYGLELIRSDVGDGGWSLHAPELADEDGLSPVLASGPAEETADGEWDRPNQLDYDNAEATRHIYATKSSWDADPAQP